MFHKEYEKTIDIKDAQGENAIVKKEIVVRANHRGKTEYVQL